ncbi:hypothetical protein EON80_06465 [bacterium]|nr:MAG: hypothetical protein EON80_06465 [bacterium]
MNPLDLIFGQVANAVRQHSSADTPGPAYDPNPILGALSGLFGQHAQQNNQQFGGYDPNADYSQHQGGDGGGILGSLGGLFGGGQSDGNVKSSDQDPYGDPEDQGGAISNVKSSDEDPYGDPEDQR